MSNIYKERLMNVTAMSALALGVLAFNPEVTQAEEGMVERIQGNDRYETATLISSQAYETSETVIIANAMEFADALSGVPLAYEKEAPILLAHGTKLKTVTITEIKRLGAKEAIILGGNAAINQSIENQLKALGLSIQRLSGDNRYETSAIIADELAKTVPSNKAVVVDGMEFADAMSIAPFAAQKGMPIYLTKTNSLSNAGELKDYSETYIVGGENAVSKIVEDALNSVTRLAGMDRYDTNREVIDHFGIEVDELYVSTGSNFADALTGSVLAARDKSAVALVKGDVHSKLLAHFENNPFNAFTILGGEAAVSNRVKGSLDTYIESKTEVIEEEKQENYVDFEVGEVEDDTIPVGEEVVDQKGEKGYELVTFDVTYLNGQEIEREEISRKVMDPIDEVIKVGTKIKVTGLSIIDTTSEMFVGETTTLNTKIMPENATVQDVKWNSSDPAIASVDEKGVLSALGEGTVTVTVESIDGGVTDSVDLTIFPVKMDSVKITNENLSLFEMETLIFKTEILPNNTTNKNLTWTSSDENIATVDSEGLLSAIKAGVVDITVTNEDKSVSDTVSLEVLKPTIISYQDLNFTITQFDEFTLPKQVLVELSNGFEKEVDVNWNDISVDTSKAGILNFEGNIEYYDYNIQLKLNIEEFVPNVTTRAYSMVTSFGLSKTLSISLTNLEYQPLEINKIELYERGKLYTTYTAEKLMNSEINTVVPAQGNWNIAVHFALGMRLDNSFVKYYVVINGEDYVFTETLD